MKHIDIIATIGPSSLSFKALKAMKASGMTVMRINTKYGSREQHLKVLGFAEKLKCKVLVDIKSKAVPDWFSGRKLDYIAVSFAETDSQIKSIRKAASKSTKIIAKIESRKGVLNTDKLIDASDGIMVARGDLGRNIQVEKVPFVQKVIIRRCNLKNKMVITATEMLLSMTNKPYPTRAEVSDVANAVIDGSDGVMLSEETSIGKYPKEAVAFMARIIKETEKHLRLLKLY